MFFRPKAFDIVFHSQTNFCKLFLMQYFTKRRDHVLIQSHSHSSFFTIINESLEIFQIQTNFLVE